MKELIVIGLLALLLSGCSGITPMGESNAVDCLKEYPDNHHIEIQCYVKTCENYNLTYNGFSSWKEPTVECSAKDGSSLDINLGNSNISECQDVVDVRIERYGCYNRWV